MKNDYLYENEKQCVCHKKNWRLSMLSFFYGLLHMTCMMHCLDRTSTLRLCCSTKGAATQHIFQGGQSVSSGQCCSVMMLSLTTVLLDASQYLKLFKIKYIFLEKCWFVFIFNDRRATIQVNEGTIIEVVPGSPITNHVKLSRGGPVYGLVVCTVCSWPSIAFWNLPICII